MINMKKRYLSAILFLMLMTNLRAGYFGQAFSKVQDVASYSLGKVFTTKQEVKTSVENLADEFEEMNTSSLSNSFISLDKQNLANLPIWFAQRDELHEISKANMKGKFSQCYISGSEGKIDKNKIGIRAYNVFVPKNYNKANKPIVLAVVHGTFAAEADEFYSINSSSPFYAYSCEFAKKLAQENQTSVEIISLQWSGKNCSKDRQDGAAMLAQVFNNFYAQHNIYTIAHSHGCNVVNSASRLLPDNISIKHAIHLACPVRDQSENNFMPKRFDKLTQFYSEGDTIAALGSLTQWNMFSAGTYRKFAQQNGKITNVRVLLNGRNIGHSNAKNDIVKNLANILDEIDNNYIINRDLIMNINRENEKEPILIAVKNPLNNIDQLANKEHLEESEIAFANDILKSELEYSKAKKDKFKETYKKEMNYNSFLFAKMYKFCRNIACEVKDAFF